MVRSSEPGFQHPEGEPAQIGLCPFCKPNRFSEQLKSPKFPIFSSEISRSFPSSPLDQMPINSLSSESTNRPGKVSQNPQPGFSWFHSRGGSQVAKATDCKSVTRGFDSLSPLFKRRFRSSEFAVFFTRLRYFVPVSPMPQSSLENRIFERLRDWQRQYPGGDGPRDLQLEQDIYTFLYSELRHVAPLLPGLGHRANHPAADVSARFTEVLNQAFTRILEKYPDRLMRTQSRRQLTGYVSRTMSSLMLNHYRSQRAFQRALQSHEVSSREDAEVQDILSQITSTRATHFENRHGLPFESALELLQHWESSDDPDLRACSEALRLRYVDGLSYDDIATALDQPRSEIELLLRRGRYRLKTLRLEEPEP
jgi:DNA-directed RNA polymerase specialized sigma24 family protein